MNQTCIHVVNIDYGIYLFKTLNNSKTIHF